MARDQASKIGNNGLKISSALNFGLSAVAS
jgi:hypothetical protein